MRLLPKDSARQADKITAEYFEFRRIAFKLCILLNCVIFQMMTKHTPQEIIDAYLNHYRTRKEKYRWSWEEVDRMRSLDDLEFILRLIQACHNDAEIAYVAAGPLKDIFTTHYLGIKERLSIMVRQHAVMRKAIQALILSPESPERKILDEILDKYGVHYASL